MAEMDKNPAVLYVDDEEKSLKMFRLICQDRFRVMTASTACQGLDMLNKHSDAIRLLVADRCLARRSGIRLLRRARLLHPHVVRLLASDGCNPEAEEALLRDGTAQGIIPIPWEPAELSTRLWLELERFATQAGKPNASTGADSDARDQCPESRTGSGPRKLDYDDYCWRLYLRPALDRGKPWKERLASFCLGIRNGLSFFACAVAVIQRRPEKGQEFSHVGQRIAESLSIATQDMCGWVRQELVGRVQQSPTDQPAVALGQNYVPWIIREDTFRSNLQSALDCSVSAIEAVRLKPGSAEEIFTKTTELVERAGKLSQEFCAMVERDFVSKIEEQKAAKDRKAWHRASAYTPRPKVDGGGGWVYSRNGE